MTKRNSRNRKKQARMPTSQAKAKDLQIDRKIVNTGYSTSGASRTKGSLASWNPIRSSPQSDIDANLSTLRARSADLYMGMPIAASAINTSRTNVIGAGLHVAPRPNYRILGISAEEAQQWALKAKEEFDLLANSKLLDITKRNNFYDLQDIAYMAYMIDGDAFALFKYRDAGPVMPYSLRLQVIESSRVGNPNMLSAAGFLTEMTVEAKNQDNGNRIINGVEIDDDGAVVAYHVANRYPYDPTNLYRLPKWVRIEAFSPLGTPNMLQICHDERPEQYRGIPYLAPAIEAIKQISRYTDAELTAAIIKSFFTLFFTETENHEAGFPVSEVLKQGKAPEFDTNSIELGPGTLNIIPPNYDVKSMDPQRSLSTYEPFIQAVTKQIGAAVGIPYEVLMKSFNSSYTASRAALLQAWSDFKMRRTWFSRDFCQPVYETWLAEAVFIGRLEAPGFFEDPLIRKAWCNSEWYGPVMGVLDPVKELQAAQLRVTSGFSTREKESLEMTGTSFDENVSRIEVENKCLEEGDLPVYPSVSTKSTGENTNPSDTGQEGAVKQ